VVLEMVEIIEEIIIMDLGDIDLELQWERIIIVIPQIIMGEIDIIKIKEMIHLRKVLIIGLIIMTIKRRLFI
jgi:hypothetical protein